MVLEDYIFRVGADVAEDLNWWKYAFPGELFAAKIDNL
jgi:hypothetical protein